MNYLVVGLGNPGPEYEKTRHNTGFIVLDQIFEAGSEWEDSLRHSTDVSESYKGDVVRYIKPQTFMNKSGLAVSEVQACDKTKPESVIVVYDDIDLPLGSIKISHGRGDGGHNGIKSIIKALGTKDFVRVRVGVTPTTPTGKLKKPKGEQAVLKFLMGDFKKPEIEKIKKVSKSVGEAIDTIVEHGHLIAMNNFN